MHEKKNVVFHRILDLVTTLFVYKPKHEKRNLKLNIFPLLPVLVFDIQRKSDQKTMKIFFSQVQLL